MAFGLLSVQAGRLPKSIVALGLLLPLFLLDYQYYHSFFVIVLCGLGRFPDGVGNSGMGDNVSETEAEAEAEAVAIYSAVAMCCLGTRETVHG